MPDPTPGATSNRRAPDGLYEAMGEFVYALVEAKSRKEAMDLATKSMDIHRVHWPEFEGECEVRPL
jgi:hypothetical protein